VSPEQLGGILPLVLIVLVFWLLVIRPARKRQQEQSRIQASVEAGSEVMLSSGIFGTVVAVADDTLKVELSPGTPVKVARQAVARIVDPMHEPPRDGASQVVDDP
jgi:preprotein translocase subunit YajC